MKAQTSNEKECRRCGEVKHHSYFSRGKNKDGFSSWCKRCHTIAACIAQNKTQARKRLLKAAGKLVAVNAKKVRVTVEGKAVKAKKVKAATFQIRTVSRIPTDNRNRASRKPKPIGYTGLHW